jgi:hypothetical protein
MRLDDKGWLYWWAYAPERLTNELWRIGERTSLCALFWRVVLFAPAGLLVVFFFRACVYVGGGIMLVSTAVLWGPRWLYVYCTRGEKQDPYESLGEVVRTDFLSDDNAVWAALRALKQKACPIVTIEHIPTEEEIDMAKQLKKAQEESACECEHVSETGQIEELQRVRLFTDYGMVSIELTDAGTWFIKKKYKKANAHYAPVIVTGKHWVTLRTDQSTVMDRKKHPQPVLQDQTQ